MSKAILIAGVAMSFAAAAPVQAAGSMNRVWVSGHGADTSGCGSVATPCRSLQYAHDNAVAAGGEIDVLDPAGYGAVNISMSVSIVNDGVGTAGVQGAAALNAINVTTSLATDTVYLRGLTIEGLGVANNGIVFTGQGTLDIVDCVVRQFAGGSGDGVYMRPSGASKFSITNTIVSDNASNGIHLSMPQGGATLTGVVSHSQMTNNALSGLFLDGGGSGVTGALAIAAVDSVAVNNNVGFYAFAGGTSTATLALRNVAASDNQLNGIVAGAASNGVATVRLAHSVVKGNATGINTSGRAIIYSYKDNDIDGNTTNVSGALNYTETTQ